MSDSTDPQTAVNDQLVLIGGYSAGGKSASLRNMRNQTKGVYLGTEAGKRLPFRNDFRRFIITDPYQVHEGFEAVRSGKLDADYVMLDSLTFLMDQFESQYVINSSNTMDGWSRYQQFFKKLMQEHVATLNKPVIITAHLKDELDEKAMEIKTSVPIKGALKNNGVEAYFSTVVIAKKVDLKELDAYGSDLLIITDEDRELGYKHVFQTRPTKKTVGERIRSPMGMFTRAQTYMDNDAQMLIDHLTAFYGA